MQAPGKDVLTIFATVLRSSLTAIAKLLGALSSGQYEMRIPKAAKKFENWLGKHLLAELQRLLNPRPPPSGAMTQRKRTKPSEARL